MATSSGWGARPIKPQDKDLICPICLEQLSVPRLLTCLHSFCTRCLNSHVLSTAKNLDEVHVFSCPVCKTNIRPPFGDKPVTEWAAQFPIDTVLAFMLPGNQSIVDERCGPCSVQGKRIIADYFCAVCKEALCRNCFQYHKSSKISKDHQIIMRNDIFSDAETTVISTEELNCIDHCNNEYKRFCIDHDEICCETCLVEKHKKCTNCRDLKTHANELMKTNRPGEVLEKMKQLEKHLVNISEIKKQNMLDLETDIKKQLSEISTLRQEINTVLDKLEECLNEEGTKILREQLIKNSDENQKLQSLLAAIKNSHKILHTWSTLGSEIRVCFVQQKMDYQLLQYQIQATDCSNTSKFNFNLSLPTCLHKIIAQAETIPVSITVTECCQVIPLPFNNMLLSTSIESSTGGKQLNPRNSVSHTAKVTEEKPQEVASDKPSNTKDIVQMQKIKVSLPEGGKMPGYCGIVCLDDDRVLLLDTQNLTCSLYDSAFHFIAKCTFISKPSRLCIVGKDKVAVSFAEEKNIQVLRVRKEIKAKRLLSTKHLCRGIAALSSKELVVSGPLNDDTYYWGVMDMKGEITSSFHISRENKFLGPGTYVALNSSKTRVYISCTGNCSVYCLDLSGKKYFEYKSHNLERFADVVIDSDDNLYVLGTYIHHLSPSGSVLQVISSEIPKEPWALCFKPSGNEFLLTTGDAIVPEVCYTYQVKKTII